MADRRGVLLDRPKSGLSAPKGHYNICRLHTISIAVLSDAQSTELDHTIKVCLPRLNINSSYATFLRYAPQCKTIGWSRFKQTLLVDFTWAMIHQAAIFSRLGIVQVDSNLKDEIATIIELSLTDKRTGKPNQSQNKCDLQPISCPLHVICYTNLSICDMNATHKTDLKEMAARVLYFSLTRSPTGLCLWGRQIAGVKLAYRLHCCNIIVGVSFGV